MKKNVKFRNHFFMVVENLLSMWILWIYLLVTIFGEGSFDEKIGSIALFGGVLLFCFVLNFITWRKTTYMFDDNAIIIERNSISKKVTTIAMSNIATVNINRSFIQGILGIRKVKVDTNSTLSTNSEVEIYLKKDDALLFQKTIMDIIDGNEDKEMSEIQENTDMVAQKKNAASVVDILLHCIFTMKIVEIIVVAVAGGFMIMTETALEEGDSVGGVMGIISTFILVGGVVISFFNSFFAYYKLQAIRNGNEINISYGFFDKKNFKIPVNKIVSVKIVEPLIGRIFKKAYGEVVCVGMGDEEKELSLLSLCMNRDELAAKLQEILPECIPDEINEDESLYTYVAEDKKALLVRILKSIFYSACIIIGGIIGISIFNDDVSEIFGAFGVVLLVICAVIFAFGVLKNKTSGYVIYKDYIKVVDGAFNRTANFIPYKRIEYMTIKKSPVTFLFGLETANISTKSGNIVDMLTNTCYVNSKDISMIKEQFHQVYKRS